MKTGDGILQSQPPKPTLAISRNMVLFATAILGCFLVVAIQLRAGARSPKPVEEVTTKPAPGLAISTLAGSYDELPKPTPIPASPRFQQGTGTMDFSALKLLAEAEVERRKRIIEARRSSLSFQGVSISSRPLGASNGEDKATTKEKAQNNLTDNDNRQDEKENFLRKSGFFATEILDRLRAQSSPYTLLSGTIIPGVLLTGLNSDLPGEILGQVSQNVFDTTTGVHLLVPQGARLVGQYDSRIVYGQERVLIVWNRLLMPNGKTLTLPSMPGTDLSGYAGLTDQVNNHYGRFLTGILFSSLLGASAQMAEGRNYNSVNPSYDELAVQGIARDTNEVGQQITRKNLNIQPTLEVRPGFRFNVFVSKDLILEPYEG